MSAGQAGRRRRPSERRRGRALPGGPVLASRPVRRGSGPRCSPGTRPRCWSGPTAVGVCTVAPAGPRTRPAGFGEPRAVASRLGVLGFGAAYTSRRRGCARGADRGGRRRGTPTGRPGHAGECSLRRAELPSGVRLNALDDGVARAWRRRADGAAGLDRTASNPARPGRQTRCSARAPGTRRRPRWRPCRGGGPAGTPDDRAGGWPGPGCGWGAKVTPTAPRGSLPPWSWSPGRPACRSCGRRRSRCGPA
ncbi:hypothetical protein HBB16_13410 [Pseudonocardia sp. MCCB 268]|nr:hypothetical protein [Pseudonocardia cytotoxica]